VLASLSLGSIAAIAFMLAFLLAHKKVWPKAVPWLMLLAGLGLAGLLGQALDGVAGLLVGVTDKGTRAVFGIGVPIGLVVLMGVYLYLHLKPKGQAPTKLTKWIALIFPPVLVTVGGVFLGVSMTTEGMAAEVTKVVGNVVETVATQTGR
jgi:hypothetical protein